MAEQAYRAINFRPDTLSMIDHMREIISEYVGQRLTARQVYYRFVAADLIPNSDKSYKKLTGILADARYAGLIDWDAIEDRGREPDLPSQWDSIEELMRVAMRQFRLPRWRGQKTYLELWVEKQALAGVLEPIARKWHVPLMVNKGYSSASAMKSAAERMIERCELQEVIDELLSVCGEDVLERDREDVTDSCKVRMMQLPQPVVLYLGDHDPSGEDMVRDIQDRLVEFRVVNVKVIKAALTMRQIKQFNPPPNPAKITDSRARAYIAKYGAQSWELDALPPRELNRIVEAGIRQHLDVNAYNEVIEEEDEQRAKLSAAMKKAEEE